MEQSGLGKCLAAEWLGTMLLVATVVGSGIMAAAIMPDPTTVATSSMVPSHSAARHLPSPLCSIIYLPLPAPCQCQFAEQFRSNWHAPAGLRPTPQFAD